MASAHLGMDRWVHGTFFQDDDRVMYVKTRATLTDQLLTHRLVVIPAMHIVDDIPHNTEKIL